MGILFSSWLVLGLLSLTTPIFWAFALLVSTGLGGLAALLSFALLFTDCDDED